MLVAVVLLMLTQTGLGFAVNGNRNWLALGPLTVQPSEIAKLSIILWAADVYAKKEKYLDNPWHALIPVAPVVGLISLLVVFQHDLRHRARAVRDPARVCSGWSVSRPGCSGSPSPWSGWSRSTSPRRTPSGVPA